MMLELNKAKLRALSALQCLLWTNLCVLIKQLYSSYNSYSPGLCYVLCYVQWCVLPFSLMLHIK